MSLAKRLRRILGGPPEVEKVAEYITQQERRHQVVSFQDEYRKLLESHWIEYVERYVWD